MGADRCSWKDNLYTLYTKTTAFLSYDCLPTFIFLSHSGKKFYKNNSL